MPPRPGAGISVHWLGVDGRSDREQVRVALALQVHFSPIRVGDPQHDAEVLQVRPSGVGGLEIGDERLTLEARRLGDLQLDNLVRLGHRRRWWWRDIGRREATSAKAAIAVATAAAGAAERGEVNHQAEHVSRAAGVVAAAFAAFAAAATATTDTNARRRLVAGVHRDGHAGIDACGRWRLLALGVYAVGGPGAVGVDRHGQHELVAGRVVARGDGQVLGIDARGGATRWRDDHRERIAIANAEVAWRSWHGDPGAAGRADRHVVGDVVTGIAQGQVVPTTQAKLAGHGEVVLAQ